MTQTMKNLFESDFGQFFHIKELNRIKIDDATETVHIKTGGFQDFIDIHVLIEQKTEIILNGKLLMHRDWLDDKTQLMFALDIIKSFLNQFSKNKDFISPLVNYLWQRGNAPLDDNKFIEAVNVISNRHQKTTFSSSENQYIFENFIDELERRKFRIEIQPAANN